MVEKVPTTEPTLADFEKVERERVMSVGPVGGAVEVISKPLRTRNWVWTAFSDSGVRRTVTVAPVAVKVSSAVEGRVAGSWLPVPV